MKRLEARLRAWEHAGILSAEQVAAIRDFEREHGGHFPFLQAVLGLGIFAIAIGIIALVAANWNEIPAGFKLAGFFGLWLTTGVAAWKRSGHRLARESLAVVHALLMFAGIGLIAQIFHLSGAPWRPFAFWCAMTLPLALVARSFLLPVLWIASATSATMLLAEQQSGEWFSPILFSLGFSVWAFGIPLSAWDRWAPPEVRLTVRRYGLLVTTAGAASASQLFWIQRQVHDSDSLFLTAAVCFGGAALASALRKARASEVTLLGVTCVLALGLLVRPDVRSQFMGFLTFVVPIAAAAFHAARVDALGAFRLCTAVLGLRLLVAYFEVFGSLATTGFGLIGAGLALIGGVYAWHKWNPARFLTREAR